MYVILVIAVAWLTLAALALAMLRSAALADRAADRHRRERRAARAALLIAAVPLAGAGAPDADAHAIPHGRSGPQATLCLINAERRVRNIAALGVNNRLARAARQHAADMVARRYFSHTAPGGGTVLARLQRVGYSGGCAWTAGETLAWGAGRGQMSPAARVAGWMRSRPHRRLLLSRGFREAGIGIAAGSPTGSRAGYTYAAELGRRRC